MGNLWPAGLKIRGSWQLAADATGDGSQNKGVKAVSCRGNWSQVSKLRSLAS